MPAPIPGDDPRMQLVARATGAVGSGTVMFVEGVSGTGKTALLDEIVRRLEGALGSCDSNSCPVPIVRLHGRRLERAEPLGALDDVLRPTTRSGNARAARNALLDLLPHGAWLVVDDLQWLDGASLAAVAGIAERAESRGIVVLAASRPEIGDRRAAAGRIVECAVGCGGFVRLALLSGQQDTGGAGDDSDTDLSDERVELLRAQVSQLSASSRAALPVLVAGGRISWPALAELEAAGLVAGEPATSVDRSEPPAGSARPLPLVRAALGQVLTRADRAEGETELLRQVVAGRLNAVDAARTLASIGYQGVALASLHELAGHDLFLTDPAEAARWYEAALQAAPERQAARSALAACHLASGRGDAALAEVACVPAVRRGAPRAPRAEGVALSASVLAVAGAWDVAAERYATAATTSAAGPAAWAQWQVAVCRAAVGELELARNAARCASTVTDDDHGLALRLLLATLDPDGLGATWTGGAAPTAGAARPSDRLAYAEQAAPLGRAEALHLADPADREPSAAALSLLEARAWAAYRTGDHGRARHLAAAALPSAGHRRARVDLLGGWAALKLGDLDDVRSVLRRNRAAACTGSALLLSLGLEAALARRTGDLFDGASLAHGALSAGYALVVDVFTVEAVGELSVLLARFGAASTHDRLSRETEALLDRLGHPPLWAAPYQWARLGAAAATRRGDRGAAPAEALRRLAVRDQRLQALATASGPWEAIARSAGVDARAVREAVSELQRAGLAWEAGELAGQAAIRLDDPVAAKELLMTAGELESRGVPVSARAPSARPDAASPGPPGPVAAEPHPAGPVATTPEPNAEARVATEPDASSLVPPEPSGDPWHPVEVDLGPVSPAGLSEREQEVGRLVLVGHTHKEIGERLFISPKTVEHHVAHIRTKLGASTRAELRASLERELASIPGVPMPTAP